MPIHQSVLELIGETPIVQARNLDTGPCTLFLKLESQNPGGSVKDRIGISMIEAAERRGDIKPGDTLVEGTAGNTGIGLALVAQQKGYKLILVVPDKMSREKIFNLKAMGAQVVLTRSDVAKGHPDYYQDMAERIARETPGAYFINQFGNPDNPAAHEFGTGPEILRQMEGEKIVGIVDESDVLLHVYGDEARFRDPVSTAMVSKLDILDVRSPVESLLPVFDRGHVAIVTEGAHFLGLITRIDLLNWLRRRVQ